MFQNGKCVRSASILNEIGGDQHWVTPQSTTPDKTTAAAVIHTPQPSKLMAQVLLSVYACAPSPSHSELSLSAQQQALFTQLLSGGSTLMKGHRTTGTHSEPAS